jgi:hypothetical protein
MLGEATTLWGDAAAFSNLIITVEATVDIATGQYLGGTFAGAGEANGWGMMINGTLIETGILGDPIPTGHEGDVDYLEVTIFRQTITVPLDIKPGSCPNPINRTSRGKLPVALLGTMDFDVSMVDLGTVALSRADGIGGSVMPLDGPPGPSSMIEDVGTPFEGEWCECAELEGDGIDDLSLKFSTPAVVEELELRDLAIGDLVELVVTGYLMDGTPFTSSDCVMLVGRDRPIGGKIRARLGQ